jgi:hypothetical protein
MKEEHYVVFGEEGPVEVSRDDFAETMWPYRTRSPAWYAARMAHNIGLSPDRWADRPELHRWLLELVAILQDPNLVERYRRELLTAEEQLAIAAEQADIEANGF